MMVIVIARPALQGVTVVAGASIHKILSRMATAAAHTTAALLKAILQPLTVARAM